MNNLPLASIIPGGQELIIIAVIVLVLFGGKKIPELMRGVGKGVGELQKGLDEGKAGFSKMMDKDEDKSEPIAPMKTDAANPPTV